MQTNKTIGLAIVYFLLSTILTWYFISTKFWFYSSSTEMMLSGAIAGGKWLAQITAALFLLKDKKWVFIQRIAAVCFIGSCILFTYNLMGFLPLPLGGFSQFVISIILSIVVMIILYFNAVKKTKISIKWFWGWIFCLLIAILLQTTVIL